MEIFISIVKAAVYCLVLGYMGWMIWAINFGGRK